MESSPQAQDASFQRRKKMLSRGLLSGGGAASFLDLLAVDFPLPAHFDEIVAKTGTYRPWKSRRCARRCTLKVVWRWKGEAVQFCLAFKPLEFEGIKPWFVEPFPYAEEQHGVLSS